MQSIFHRLKRILSVFLIVIIVTTSLSFTAQKPVLAAPSLNFEIPQQLDQILSNQHVVADAKQLLSNQHVVADAKQLLSNQHVVEDAKQLLSNQKFLKDITLLLSNTQLVEEANLFLNSTPESICGAYRDNLQGLENSNWQAVEKGATAMLTITQAVASASGAGAGSLAGYAGIASAVSQLGLGGLTTTIAGMMGSSVTGAAATAVVTSAVGGPVVMSAILIGGTGAATFGTYELGKFTIDKLGSWAKDYCNVSGV